MTTSRGDRCSRAPASGRAEPLVRTVFTSLDNSDRRRRRQDVQNRADFSQDGVAVEARTEFGKLPYSATVLVCIENEQQSACPVLDNIGATTTFNALPGLFVSRKSARRWSGPAVRQRVDAEVEQPARCGAGDGSDLENCSIAT